MNKKGIKDMSIEGYKDITEEAVAQTGYKGRLLRFLFNPPPLAKFPPTWVATDFAGLLFFNRFAARLAKSPPDLVAHLGMVRSNAYFDAGCPLVLCDHAAARDLWKVIHQDELGKESLCH
ncbi:MAG: hypothetical protein WCH99_15150 [Verrucomicrobiota bacterium]